MKIDKKRFYPTIIIIMAVLIFVIFNLQIVQDSVNTIYDYLSHDFSWLFIGANIAALVFSIWIIFGPYKNVKLGGKDAKPEYSNFSWISMIFTTSCSAGLIVFGFIESIIYASNPPFQIEPFSTKAYEYAQMYSHYHWGINAWSLYIPISIAIGYMYYNRKKKSISMSTACEPILEKKSEGVLGCIVDILGTFGAIVAPVTSMGLGMPLLTLLLQNLLNIPDDKVTILQILILVIWIAIFGTSVFKGLKKGIKNLSNANVIIAFAFMFFTGIIAGLFIAFKSEINTLGLYITNFVRMATYTDPFGNGDFVGGWTVWYWAWLIVYMPLMGVFNAKISKGRTLKEIALGQMIWCSLGCWIAMSTLGNYAIKLQQSGMVDIANILNTQGQPQAILAIISAMPFPKVMMAIVATLCFVFMATTVDSSSFVAAETTMIHNNPDDMAPRWSRILWAIITCIITFVLLQVGGFNAVQVLAILIGFPLSILMFVVIASAIKALRQDDPNYRFKNINIFLENLKLWKKNKKISDGKGQANKNEY